MQQEYVISSILGNVKIIDVILHRLQAETILSNKQLFEIRLALNEGITNAILHGNKSNPEKCVVIQYKCFNNKIEFCIIDEGKGFEIKELPDPTKGENIESPGGRGVFLIQKLSHFCHYCTDQKAFQFSFNI